MKTLTIQALKAYNRGKTVNQIQTFIKNRLNVSDVGTVSGNHTDNEQTYINTVMALYGNYNERKEYGKTDLFTYMQQFNGLPLEVIDNKNMQVHNFGTFHDFREMFLLLDRYVEKMQVINEPASNQIIISITLY